MPNTEKVQQGDSQGEHNSHGHGFQPSFGHPCLVNCHSSALTFNVLLGSSWTSLFSRHTGDNRGSAKMRFESNLKNTIITPNRCPKSS